MAPFCCAALILIYLCVLIGAVIATVLNPGAWPDLAIAIAPAALLLGLYVRDGRRFRGKPA